MSRTINKDDNSIKKGMILGQKSITEPTYLNFQNIRWGSVETDFIVSFPKSSFRYHVITTFVEQLSRRVRYVPSKTTGTAVDCANVLFTNVFPHHGLLDEIISDLDPRFTPKFWDILMEPYGITLKMSSSMYPQMHRSSKGMHHMVDTYFGCYCTKRPNYWRELLPAAEFAYHSALNEDLGMSLF